LSEAADAVLTHIVELTPGQYYAIYYGSWHGPVGSREAAENLLEEVAEKNEDDGN